MHGLIRAASFGFGILALGASTGAAAAESTACVVPDSYSGSGGSSGAYYINAVGEWGAPEGPWNSRDPTSFQTFRYAGAEARRSRADCIRFEGVKTGGATGLLDAPSALANYQDEFVVASYAWANMGTLRTSAQVLQEEPEAYATLDGVANVMSRAASIDLLQISSAEEFGFLRGRIRVSGDLVVNPQVARLLSEPGLSDASSVFSRDVVSQFWIEAKSGQGETTASLVNYLGRMGSAEYVLANPDDPFSWAWVSAEEGLKASHLSVGTYVAGEEYFSDNRQLVYEEGLFSRHFSEHVIEFSVPYSIHDPVWLFQHLTCGIGGATLLAGAPSSYGNASCEFSESAHWLGAVLTDRQGNLIEGSIRSASGFDYLRPSPFLPEPAGAIPEPGSWAMLIAGFGVVGASLRRRRLVAA